MQSIHMFFYLFCFMKKIITTVLVMLAASTALLNASETNDCERLYIDPIDMSALDCCLREASDIYLSEYDRERIINDFFYFHSDLFHNSDLMLMSNMMDRMSDRDIIRVVERRYYNPAVMSAVSILGGYLGIDRFIVGDPLLGTLKLLTAGGFGIWYVTDLFFIYSRAQTKNFKRFKRSTSVEPVYEGEYHYNGQTPYRYDYQY